MEKEDLGDKILKRTSAGDNKMDGVEGNEKGLSIEIDLSEDVHAGNGKDEKELPEEMEIESASELETGTVDDDTKDQGTQSEDSNSDENLVGRVDDEVKESQKGHPEEVNTSSIEVVVDEKKHDGILSSKPSAAEQGSQSEDVKPITDEIEVEGVNHEVENQENLVVKTRSLATDTLDEELEKEEENVEDDSESGGEHSENGKAATATSEKLSKKSDSENERQEETKSSRTEELQNEVKEKEPVFDGTEVPGMANRGISSNSMDQDPENPATVAEKAMAVKNFVKEKSTNVVSTFIRRLSGKKDGDEDEEGKSEEGQGLTDGTKANAGGGDREGATDAAMGTETKDASQKTEERSGWNPLSFLIMSRDTETKPEVVDGVKVEEETILPIAMKGRIVLYTRLGCQDCKEARFYLHKKRLGYVEVNIDVYPSRKQELEKISRSSSVPKIFFNEVLIGGLSEIKSLDESGKLAEKIDYLIAEAPSIEAPLPPLSGEDDESNNGTVDENALLVRKMREVIVVRDRFSRMRRFASCFLGSDAVNFISEDQYLEREEAVEFGRKLASQFFFQHVLEDNLFEDGNHLYRFLDQDPIVVSQGQNMPRGILDAKPKPITEIASRLRFLQYAMLEAYSSENGKHLDYRSIHGSEEFARYLRTIEELQRVDLQDMTREEKLAFWINLYNMMAIHVILVWGHPTGALERRRVFGDFKYVVGGCTYSLSAIENGILRVNQRPPYNLVKPFGAKDRRVKLILPYVEPLIHFALVCGTRSGPALRCYSPGNIDKELMEAAHNFVKSGGLVVDLNNKVASVSKILKWFSVDFGKNETEVMKHAANYLDPPESEAMLELLANNQLKVTYQPYDWGLNH